MYLLVFGKASVTYKCLRTHITRKLLGHFLQASTLPSGNLFWLRNYRDWPLSLLQKHDMRRLTFKSFQINKKLYFHFHKHWTVYVRQTNIAFYSRDSSFPPKKSFETNIFFLFKYEIEGYKNVSLRLLCWLQKTGAKYFKPIVSCQIWDERWQKYEKYKCNYYVDCNRQEQDHQYRTSKFQPNSCMLKDEMTWRVIK